MRFLWLVALSIMFQGPFADAFGQPEAQVEVVSQVSHSFPIQQVSFSADGRYALSRDTEELKLWEVATGRLVRSIQARFVKSCELSADGKKILVALNSLVLILDSLTGTVSQELGHQSKDYVGASFVPNTDNVILLQRNALLLWNPSSAKRLVRLAEHGCSKLRFSADGKLFACGLYKNAVELWDSRAMKPRSTFKGNSSALVIKWLGFSAENKTLFAAVCDYYSYPALQLKSTGSARCFVESWDVKTHAPRFFSEVQKSLVTAAYSSTLNQLVTVATEDYIEESGAANREIDLKGGTQFVDADTGATIESHLFNQEIFEGDGEGVAISVDGTKVLAGGRDGSLILIDARTAARISNFGEVISPLTSIAYSQAKNELVTGDRAGNIRLWDLSNGTLAWQISPGGDESDRDVRYLGFSSDGSLIVSVVGWFHSAISIWDAQKRALVQKLNCDDCSGLSSFVFSHDHRWLITGGDAPRQRTLLLWDLVSGNVKHDFGGHRGSVSSVAFSKDDATLVTDGDDGQNIWETTTGYLAKKLGRLKSPQVENGRECGPGALSPDGRLVLCPMATGDADDGPYVETLWEVGTRKFLSPIGDPWVIGSSEGGPLFQTKDRVIFSSDSSNIGILRGRFAEKMNVSVWDAGIRKQVAGFVGDNQQINSLAVYQGGSRLITGGDDGTIRLWGRSGEQLIRLVPSGNDYVTITPAGFFKSSDTDSKSVAVVRGMQTYAVSQFRDQLFREDLVQDWLSGDVLGRYRDAASKINLGAILKSGAVPTIKFVSESDWAGDTIQLTVRLFNNEGGGIGKELEWRVINKDGKSTLQGTTTPPELQNLADPDGPIEVTHGLKLDPDQDNLVTVTAKNGQGRLATEPYKIEVIKNRLGEVTPGDSVKPQPRMFIVAIGVDGYTEPQLAKLNYPLVDVEALADAIKAVAEASGYKEAKVIKRLEQEAVRGKIKSAFDEIIAFPYQRVDTIVILLAGHGKSVDGKYYYLPFDTHFGIGQDIFTEGISSDSWKEWIAGIKVDKKLLVVDTCESSDAIAIGRGSRDDAAHITALDRLRSSLGESVVTAARQVAYEGSFLGHGVLTYSVLEALGTPRPDGSMIDLNALKAYLEEAVPRWSQKLSGLPQDPFIKINGNFQVGFPLAKVRPAPVNDETPLPGEYFLGRDVEVRTAADPGGGLIETLKAYTKVQVLKFDGDWTKIVRQGVPRGWVPHDAVIRLLP